MARPNALLASKADHRVLALMLLLLHFAVMWDFGGALSRSLMLAHFGLFLIWQPFWSHAQRIDLASVLVFALAATLYLFWYGWPLVTFWSLVLIGLVAGRASVNRRQRYVHLMAIVFLVSEVLVGCIPPIFRIQALSSQFMLMFRYGLLVLPVVMLLIPVRRASDDAVRSIDFLYGVLIALLTLVVALGALLRVFVTDVHYPVAVIEVALAGAAFLLALSWLWMPVGGFSGFGQLWERYLQNIGTPFELWLAQLARLAGGKQTPDQFLQSAVAQLMELPWMAGVAWELDGVHGGKGLTTPHSFRSRHGELAMTGYANRQMGTALLLHAKLLLQLIAHFHRAKQREQELTRRAHLQAIYETGARVTHDIKNLLQSLYTMSAALQESSTEADPEVQRLLKKQLPHLTQRLQLALDKLKTPETLSITQCKLSDWWEAVKSRNVGRHIHFAATVDADPLIPEDLFDSVVENLIENARAKRMIEPDITIDVLLLASADDDVKLRVSDTGTALDPGIAQALFKAPVHSDNGLGIGLYQAARQAEQLGYRLRVVNDTKGVCFELGPMAAQSVERKRA